MYCVVCYCASSICAIVQFMMVEHDCAIVQFNVVEAESKYAVVQFYGVVCVQ